MKLYYTLTIIVCIQITILADIPLKDAEPKPNKIERTKKTVEKEIRKQTMSASIKALALPGIFWGTYATIKSAKDIYNTIKPLPSVDEVGQEVFDIMRESNKNGGTIFIKRFYLTCICVRSIAE